MDTEKLGEIFLNGKIINLDNVSEEVLDNTLTEINIKKEEIIDRINSILAEIQN